MRLVLEEFSSELINIKGYKNIVTDAHSRQDKTDDVDNNKVNQL